MRIENSTIIFKSYPENYNPEASGLKQNSLRIIPKDEIPNFKIENGTLFINGVKITHIKIYNTQTQESFTKSLTWVTKFNDEFLFSWNDTINAAKIPAFSQCQQIKLDANSHKTPIHKIEIPYIIARLHEEVKELQDEVFTETPDPIKVCDEAVDVANFALFIYTKFSMSPEEYQQYIDSKYDQIRSKKE